MHIAVVSLGAFGHVNPTLQLVAELVKRGGRVTYFTTEDFRKIIEPTGATFVAVPSWMADNAPKNQEKKDGAAGDSMAAVVPFLFLNEAGGYIDTVLGGRASLALGSSRMPLRAGHGTWSQAHR